MSWDIFWLSLATIYGGTLAIGGGAAIASSVFSTFRNRWICEDPVAEA